MGNTMIGRMSAHDRQEPWRQETARTILVAACDVAQTYCKNSGLSEEELVKIMQERNMRFENMEIVLDVLMGRNVKDAGPGRPATEAEIKARKAKSGDKHKAPGDKRKAPGPPAPMKPPAKK